MRDLIYCEFLKLKRSKVLLICFLGALVTPLMMFVDGIKVHNSNPDEIFTTESYYYNCMSYTLIAFGLLVIIVLEAYLFSREYSERTLKTMLTIPVSKTMFILSKFVVLFIMNMIFSLISWAAMGILSAILNAMLGMPVFDWKDAIEYLVRMMAGGVLLFMVVTPFAFIAIWTKGYIVPVITGAAIVLANAGLMNETIGAIFPWTSIEYICVGTIADQGYSIAVVWSIIIAVFVAGIAATVLYFKTEDIK